MNRMTKFGLVFFISALPLGANAKKSIAGTTQERTWTGTLTEVNAQDNTLRGRRWLPVKTFIAGEHCAISPVDKKNAGLSDLHAGEKVKIQYQNVQGVRVADRIIVQAMRFAGTVQEVDRNDGLLTLKEGVSRMTFRLAPGCEVTRWDGRQGALADVRSGDNITVTYELPEGSPVAYRVCDENETFVGTISSINLPDHTVNASEGPSANKEFTLAHGCQIVINGKERNALHHLDLGRQYMFTYQ